MGLNEEQRLLSEDILMTLAAMQANLGEMRAGCARLSNIYTNSTPSNQDSVNGSSIISVSGKEDEDVLGDLENAKDETEVVDADELPSDPVVYENNLYGSSSLTSLLINNNFDGEGTSLCSYIHYGFNSSTLLLQSGSMVIVPQLFEELLNRDVVSAAGLHCLKPWPNFWHFKLFTVVHSWFFDPGIRNTLVGNSRITNFSDEFRVDTEGFCPGIICTNNGSSVATLQSWYIWKIQHHVYTWETGFYLSLNCMGVETKVTVIDVSARMSHHRRFVWEPGPFSSDKSEMSQPPELDAGDTSNQYDHHSSRSEHAASLSDVDYGRYCDMIATTGVEISIQCYNGNGFHGILKGGTSVENSIYRIFLFDASARISLHELIEVNGGKVLFIIFRVVRAACTTSAGVINLTKDIGMQGLEVADLMLGHKVLHILISLLVFDSSGNMWFVVTFLSAHNKSSFACQSKLLTAKVIAFDYYGTDCGSFSLSNILLHKTGVLIAIQVQWGVFIQGSVVVCDRRRSPEFGKWYNVSVLKLLESAELHIVEDRLVDSRVSSVKELQQHGSPYIVIALAGKKADREESLQVSVEDATEYAHKNVLFFIETSAKAADNINQLFEEITGFGNNAIQIDALYPSIFVGDENQENLPLRKSSRNGAWASAIQGAFQQPSCQIFLRYATATSPHSVGLRYFPWEPGPVFFGWKHRVLPEKIELMALYVSSLLPYATRYGLMINWDPGILWQFNGSFYTTFSDSRQCLIAQSPSERTQVGAVYGSISAYFQALITEIYNGARGFQSVCFCEVSVASEGTLMAILLRIVRVHALSYGIICVVVSNVCNPTVKYSMAQSPSLLSEMEKQHHIERKSASFRVAPSAKSFGESYKLLIGAFVQRLETTRRSFIYKLGITSLVIWAGTYNISLHHPRLYHLGIQQDGLSENFHNFVPSEYRGSAVQTQWLGSFQQYRI